ncbi:HNH endonuclease [Enemella sp. A6]|uniref:HNH endonuclease n=1 Tax=Enemella sp. A6 TaxID=3440152 RepID=UPI003EBCA7B6
MSAPPWYDEWLNDPARWADGPSDDWDVHSGDGEDWDAAARQLLTERGPAVDRAARSCVVLAEVGAALDHWHELIEDHVVAADAGGLLQIVEEVTRVRAMLNSVEVRAGVGFDALVRREQVAQGVPADRVGKGVAQDLALARRDSPGRTSNFLAAARTTVRDLPLSLARLRAGEANPEAVAAVATQVSVLGPDHRAEVDVAIADKLCGMSRREADGASRAMADQLDPQAAARRRKRGYGERRVTVRPAPDDMAYLTALLPMKQAIAVKASLAQAAASVIAHGGAAAPGPPIDVGAGDAGAPADTASPEDADPTTAPPAKRSQAQIEADLFVQILTGQAAPDATALMLNVLVPAATLAGGDEAATVSLGGTGVGVTGPVNIPAAELRVQVAHAARHGARHSIRAVGIDDAGRATTLTRAKPLPDKLLTLIRARTGPDSEPDALIDAVREQIGRIALNSHSPIETDDATVDIGARLVTEALSSDLVADAETMRGGRFASGSLRELIEIRDQTCRTPYCDAPIRDIDHVTPDTEGGATTTGNLQGLCKACNLTKDLPSRRLGEYGKPRYC